MENAFAFYDILNDIEWYEIQSSVIRLKSAFLVMVQFATSTL